LTVLRLLTLRDCRPSKKTALRNFLWKITFYQYKFVKVCKRVHVIYLIRKRRSQAHSQHSSLDSLSFNTCPWTTMCLPSQRCEFIFGRFFALATATMPVKG
jgi:hypothetical protein